MPIESKTFAEWVATVEALRAENESLRALLREVEWKGESPSFVETRCLFCGGGKPEEYDEKVRSAEQQRSPEWQVYFRRELALTTRGHTSDCRLASAIREEQ
jgi:hypothetical protein